MTPEQMRIAIAEYLGWKWYRRPATGPWAAKPMRSLYHPEIHPEYIATMQLADMTERQCNSEFLWREGMIPNWPEDLNACAEFEETLNIRELNEYIGELDKYPQLGRLAKAPQRCEAFLRTKGLWT